MSILFALTILNSGVPLSMVCAVIGLVIAVIIFILLFIFKDHATAIGFVIGAFCSLAAGFIGMRVAVLANVRTTQAASVTRTAALRIAFNGGAVTGLLVVGLALLAVSIFYTVAGKTV